MKSVRKNASHQGAEARIPDPAGRGPEVARGHLVQVSRPVQLEGELRRCRLPLQEQVSAPGALFVYRVWSCACAKKKLYAFPFFTENEKN